MRLRTFYFALMILSSALWIACDSDDDSTTPGEMMNNQGTDDPYNLGGTYHDYRSCMEQEDDPVEEPMSMMEEEEEEMMSDMDEEMSMEDTSELFEDLPRGSGAPLMGVNGICLICHGSSEARTIANAIGRARPCDGALNV